MPNLGTNYLSLNLKNPIIVASSGFTRSVEKIKECAEAGAGAVVLKSLFEEALSRDTWGIEETSTVFPEAFEYIAGELELQYGLADYTKLIREAKAAVDIPIIASINCVSDQWWPGFAKKIEEAGADALELNVFTVPTDEKIEAHEQEQLYYDILKKTKEEIKIPVAMKIGPYFSSLPNFAENLYIKGLNGLVMFNRFTEPDIDIEKLEIKTTFEFTKSADTNHTLRWVALTAKENMEMDLCATTGIHNSSDVIKMLLAGASTVQIASEFYQNGLGTIKTILKEMEAWMEKHKFSTVSEFKGKLTFEHTESPKKYLRSQFLEKIRGIE